MTSRHWLYRLTGLATTTAAAFALLGCGGGTGTGYDSTARSAPQSSKPAVELDEEGLPKKTD